MFPIHEVRDLDLAFPANVLPYMPKWDDIPEEFQNGNSKENKFISKWFFQGIRDLDLSPREGVDPDKAVRHIQMILGSFEPKHEHKEAACAFLMREWFEDFSYEVAKKKIDETNI